MTGIAWWVTRLWLSMSDLGVALIALARAAIEGRVVRAEHPDLDAPGATFVTLTKGGRLRGCIGSLGARRLLREDVASNARAAAFRDPRFAPVTPAEFGAIRVEVSLLTTPEPVDFVDEPDAIRNLHYGFGYVLSGEGMRGTFLPQVWEQLPEPTRFWAQLRLKAGFPDGYWGPAVSLEQYQVRKWTE